MLNAYRDPRALRLYPEPHNNLRPLRVPYRRA